MNMKNRKRRFLICFLVMIVALLIAAMFAGCDEDSSEQCEHPNKTLINQSSPTCTQDGSASYLCDDCGAKWDIILPAQHTEAVSDAIAPTCTETGLTEGKYCTVCQAVLIEQQVIPALGHEEEIVNSQDSTCTVAGFVNYHCTVCGASRTVELALVAHTYDSGII